MTKKKENSIRIENTVTEIRKAMIAHRKANPFPESGYKQEIIERLCEPKDLKIISAILNENRRL